MLVALSRVTVRDRPDSFIKMEVLMCSFSQPPTPAEVHSQRDPSTQPCMPVGSIIAGCTVEVCLSHTRYASVYRVYDSFDHASRVLKIVPPRDRLVTALEREVLVMRTLERGNGTRVHRSDRLNDGRAFYIMDWIDGETIPAHVLRGTLAVRDALLVTRSVATTLAIAHDALIVHCDLKPDNIVVPNADGPPKFAASVLLDFGIHLRLVEGPAGAIETTAGHIAGTVRYMAPEQFSGRPLGAPTDVYGLGATLFFMLYGRPIRQASDILEAWPLSGDGPRVFSGPGVIRCLTREIDLPSAPKYDLRLRSLLTRMLRIDPAERPQEMRDVLHNVDRLLKQ